MIKINTSLSEDDELQITKSRSLEEISLTQDMLLKPEEQQESEEDPLEECVDASMDSSSSDDEWSINLSIIVEAPNEDDFSDDGFDDEANRAANWQE